MEATQEVEANKLQEAQQVTEEEKKALEEANRKLQAEMEAKAAKKKPEKQAAKNSVDPTSISVEKVNATTKAADSRAKRGMTNDECGMTNDAAAAAEQIAGIQDSKIGKATGWTPADVEAGAKLLKAKSHDITALIGSKPDAKKDPIAYKNWNGLRMKLLRKAGLAA